MGDSFWQNWTRRRLRTALERRLTILPVAELGPSLMVFAPHQDDETLACGGTIIQAIHAGSTVSVVFTTDGATSHQKLLPAERMREIRRKEALQASQVLGLAPEAVHFLGFPNRELSQQAEAAIQEVLTLLQEHRPDVIFVPHHLEQPSDHKATNHTVREALNRLQRRVRVYAYPVWLWQHWPWTRPQYYQRGERWLSWWQQLKGNQLLLKDFRCAVDVHEVQDIKAAALACHASQMTRLVDRPDWSTLGDISDGDFLECFRVRYEIFHAYPQNG